MTRRTASTVAALTLLAVAAAAGCYTGPNPADPAIGTPTSATDPTDPTLPGASIGESDDGGGTTPAAATGIPCDVEKVLTTSCTGCHGTKLTNGAPNSLVSYADLTALSKDDPTKTVAQVSVERMQATKRMMPPDGALDAADIATVAAWVTAGVPKGSCGVPGAGDGGSAGSDGGGTTPTADGGGPPPVTSVCTSGQTWPAGSDPSALMHPGKACLACHAMNGAPTYQLAGTVFPTLHEPDDCLGSSVSGMTVVIVDAAGTSHTVPVNANGNFYRVTSIPLPYRATIVSASGTREMKTPQTDGDCNGCHSELGTKSPGRIMQP